MKTEEYYEIEVGKSVWAKVDLDDLEKVKPFLWRLNGDGYAIASCWVDDYKTTVRMHRLILDAEVGQFVDHINGDPLDNRRSNLRVCSQPQNMRNRRSWNSLGFKGVQKLKNGKYSARLAINGKQTHLGCFESVEEAAKAYDLAAAQHFGSFARPNFMAGAA